ncbi:MAG: aspartate kinase [Chitinophagales bacterium]|nr:aspartate kinase [Chitinophagales bacterium]
MRVFKFGGASVKDATGIKNVANIIANYGSKNKLVVIVSATGKTTNALEDVVNAYYNKSADLAEKVALVKNNHLKICSDLFDENHAVFDTIENIFNELQWQLEEDRMEQYNYVYDQIVSQGEMLSTQILSAYLNDIGLQNHWLDARDVVKTDATYREAIVDWTLTSEKIQQTVPSIIEMQIVITQGFIGCTDENCTTTLGREGSDYTAAIFANILDAEHQTIWKDVPGVMNGDPRVFEDAIFLDQISYNEAVEMTFYGATVIHPKTIKPLQNKNIPLHVRSFINPDGKGTIVGEKDQANLPPIRIVKNNQSLITLHTKDFSFIQEDVLAGLMHAFHEAKLKLNMLQQGAISFEAVVNDIPEKIEAVNTILANDFTIAIENNLSLLTIRHYDEATISKHRQNRTELLAQRSTDTYQGLLK